MIRLLPKMLWGSFLSVLLALSFGVATPTQASASTDYYGNIVTELYGSTADLSVSQIGTWSAWHKMRPNSDSDGWPTFIRNVKCFYVPSYHTAVSRYGYGYKGYSTGHSYCFTSGNNHIYLQVMTNECYNWYLTGYPCPVRPPA